MRTKRKLSFALAVGALAVVGCGGGDSGSEEDRAAIEGLVTQINRANADRDGAAYCDLLQPSTFLDTFPSRARCVRETNQILDQAGRQPALVVENISVDGDTARVAFAERSGEAPFVKEDDRWYLALGQAAAEPADGEAGGEAAGRAGEGAGDGGAGGGSG